MYAYITKSAKFFPNEPVSNDEMESYLGMVDNKPSSMILTCYPVEQPLPNSLYPHME